MNFKPTLITALLFTCTQSTFAQIDGGNAYLMGDFINIAIDSAKGREGTNVVGAGFHQRAPGTRCGFVADPEATG
jgi:hypothetical protein